MCANAQRDDRPDKYRWCPLFNAAKFGWRPLLLECRAVTLPRRQTRWNLQGCPKLTKWSQPPVGRSSPYCEDMWRRCCSLVSFPIVDTCLSCKDIARQVVGWCPDADFLAIFCVLYFQRATHSTFQTCILNLQLGHTMCGSMVDIQSPTAEIRRGNKKRRRNHRMKI